MPTRLHTIPLLFTLLILAGCGSFHYTQARIPIDQTDPGAKNSTGRVYDVVEAYADRYGFQCARSEQLLNCVGQGASPSGTNQLVTYVTGYRCVCRVDSTTAATGGQLTIEFKPDEPARANSSTAFAGMQDRLVGMLAEEDYACDCAESQVREQTQETRSAGAGGTGIILVERYSDMVIVEYMQQSDNLGPPSEAFRQHRQALQEELQRQFDNVLIR